MHKDNVVHIGELLGIINQIDECEDSRVCVVGFVWYNVNIDISKPLLASFSQHC